MADINTITNALKRSLGVKNPAAKVVVLSIEAGSKEGIATSATSNFSIYRAMVEVDGRLEKHSLFCKTMYEVEGCVRKFVTRARLYPTETGVYQDLFPYMEQFQKERKVLPLCLAVTELYGVSDNCIVLGDLMAKGFRTTNKICLSYEEVVISLRELAKLHAISNTLLLCKDNIFDQFFLRETVFTSDMFDVVYHLFTTSYTAAINMVNNVDQELGQKMTKYQNKVFDTLMEQVSRHDKSFRTICHGDLWFSNIMFLYDQTGVPVEVKFVDFQKTKVGSLALDLTFLLYTSTTREFRKAHYREILQIYCNEFQSTLTYLGESPMFTIEDLMQEMKEALPFAVTFMAFSMPMQLNGDPKDFCNMNSGNQIPLLIDIPDIWKEADKCASDRDKNSQVFMAQNLARNMYHPDVQRRMLEFYREMSEMDII